MLDAPAPPAPGPAAPDRQRAANICQALLLNAVPIWGLWRSGWAGSTLLVLYWSETVLTTLANAVRIALHRRLTRTLGHDGPRRLADGRLAPRAFLREYLGIAALFGAAHGLFLAALLWVMSTNLGMAPPDAADLRLGLARLSLAIVLGLGLDLPRLRHRPFAWVRRLRDVAVQRVFVVHLTIVLGVAGMAWLGQPAIFFALFVAFKLLVDLVNAWGTDDVPERPPGCLLALSRHLSPETDVDAAWRRAMVAERESAARAEATAEPRSPTDAAAP